MTEPRSWKWMLPSFLFILFFMLGFYISDLLAGEWKCLAILPFGLSLIWGIGAIRNHAAYYSRLSAETFALRQDAMIQTPETLLFQYAKGMHPEAVRLLLLQRKRLWMIKRKTGSTREAVDWVLFDAPIVHVDFITYFLEHSNAVQCMPKRLLSQGAKKFDPEGQATDYEQYDAFIAVLQRSLICTQAWGNQAPQWIPPWDPETVGRDFGIRDDEDQEAEGTTSIQEIR